jgi:predicted membrane protein
MKKVLNSFFKKSDNFLTCGIGAYLMMILVDLLTSTSKDLFLTLSPISLLKLGVFFVSVPLLIFVPKKISSLSIHRINIIVSSLILLVAIFKSISFFLALGFIFLSLLLFTGAFLRNEKYSYLYLFVILLTTPRLLTLASINLQDTALGFHAINLAETRFNTILWPVLLAFFLSAIFLILFNNLPIEKYIEKYKKIFNYSVLSFVILYVVYLSIIVIYKVKTFDGSTFDIGIFSQMFHRMSTDLTAITTLERDRVLSHFAVHISPIFYLMLPFYKVFPHVETLEVLQIWVVFSAVIPLRLLLKRLNFSKSINSLIIAWFVLIPVMTTAGGYHLHENCFLVPLIIWLFYFISSEQKWKILLVTLLLLFVKEDAFIYVVSIGLYFLFQKRFSLSSQTKKWIILADFILPVLYFALGLYLLNTYGEGGMVSRFEPYLLEGENGILSVLKNLILHPTYVFSKLLIARKLGYLFFVLAPLVFLPLVQRTWSNYLLSLPLIVINLLPDWPYQYDIGFQYSYGSQTLLFIMALLALEDLKEHKFIKEKTTLAMVTVGIIMSGTLLHHFTHNWSFNIGYYFEHKEKFDTMRYTLESLPEEASVVTEGGYTPALRNHQYLYDIFYHNDKKADDSIDYIVIPREQKGNNKVYDPIIESYESLGYKESKYATKELFILEKP